MQLQVIPSHFACKVLLGKVLQNNVINHGYELIKCVKDYMTCFSQVCKGGLKNVDLLNKSWS